MLYINENKEYVLDFMHYARISYRNGWNTEALIFENLKPVEISKESIQLGVLFTKTYDILPEYIIEYQI